MRRKQIVVASLILSAIVIGGIAFFFLRSTRDPVYQGKRLSVWLKEYDFRKTADGKGISEGDVRKADEIVKQAGTNAIPTLLRLLREEDSKKHNIDSTGGEASDGFRVLGASATNAVPDLMKIYEQNRAARIDILYSLNCIGTNADVPVDWLLPKLKDPDRQIRAGIAYVLANMHLKSEQAIPVLIQCLSDSDRMVRGDTALALGSCGTDAKSAIPQLIDLLNDKAKGVRNCATLAIKEIDPEAAAKAGLK
jgi:HEAT repeat protein